jgi:hypothetical protein
MQILKSLAFDLSGGITHGTIGAITMLSNNSYRKQHYSIAEFEKTAIVPLCVI